MKVIFSGSAEQAQKDKDASDAPVRQAEAVLIESNSQTFDNAEFHSIYETHYARISAISRRMLHNKDDAEDIAQETFIRAYLNYGKLDPRAPVFAWLCKIATNLCIDTARKNKNIRVISLDTFYASETLQKRAEHFLKIINLGENIEMQEMVGLMNQVLNTMPPHYSQVIVLRGCDEYPPSEVADIMGISVTAVNNIFCRAKKKFKELYRELSAQQNQALIFFMVMGRHAHRFHFVMPKLHFILPRILK